MNSLLQVEDISVDEIARTSYSAAFLATGYESRCVSLSEMLDPAMVTKPVLWGFEREVLPSLRKAHDLHFLQKWGVHPKVLRHSDFQAAWKSVREVLGTSKTASGPFRILVDYSSMSRIWYAAVLSFFRFASKEAEIVLDFSYTPGKYSKAYADEMKSSVVTQIISIPGMEGLSGTRESSIAVLGLGFTPAAGLGVLERLQPHLIFSFYANPAAVDDYMTTCLRVNKQLTEGSRFLLPLPLQSVSTSYRKLCEALIPYLGTQQITFIPMGPKPHVLTSMLVASRFKQVSCMYAQLARRDVSDIEKGGEPVGARITLSRAGC